MQTNVQQLGISCGDRPFSTTQRHFIRKRSTGSHLSRHLSSDKDALDVLKKELLQDVEHVQEEKKPLSRGAKKRAKKLANETLAETKPPDGSPPKLKHAYRSALGELRTNLETREVEPSSKGSEEPPQESEEGKKEKKEKKELTQEPKKEKQDKKEKKVKDEKGGNTKENTTKASTIFGKDPESKDVKTSKTPSKTSSKTPEKTKSKIDADEYNGLASKVAMLVEKERKAKERAQKLIIREVAQTGVVRRVGRKEISTKPSLSIRQLVSKRTMSPAREEAIRLYQQELEKQKAMVDEIKSGSLSQSDMVGVMRNLRASLLAKQQRNPLPASGPTITRLLSKESPHRTPRIGSDGTNSSVASAPPMSIQERMQVKPSARGTRVIRRRSTRAVTEASGQAGGDGYHVQKVEADELQLVPLEKAQDPVPKLAYGLERVLFNPGVYHLQDPRSRVYNFDPYLQNIMPVADFDFSALKQYITSSRDETLLGIAKQAKMKYTGSTSSMTSALAHFHFLLSQWRPINAGMLSRDFPVEYESFTALQRGPAAVFLRYKDGTYAIDGDKQFDSANILSMLGKSMEKLLTLPTEDFEMYRRENSDQISAEERSDPESFHYTTIGDFLLRSQLDAYDPRLPGTGMFDLKTRAVVSIRMDVQDYEQGMGYEIRGRHGEWESYEREYYDMIRAAFLKYSLQVRMGRMDGIFVAFHNIRRIFGFQYISLPEMDKALHGTDNTAIGDSEFKLSLDLLNKVLDRATKKFPEKSLRLHFETRDAGTPFMYIFAEPMEAARIDEIQNTNRKSVLEFEERVLGLSGKSEEELSEIQRAAEWESLRAKVEESMESDESGVMSARTIVETLMGESSYWDDLTEEQKAKRIDALLASISSGESSTGGNTGNVPVDNEEDISDEEEEEGDSMDEDDTNEEEDENEAEEGFMKDTAKEVLAEEPALTSGEAESSDLDIASREALVANMSAATSIESEAAQSDSEAAVSLRAEAEQPGQLDGSDSHSVEDKSSKKTMPDAIEDAEISDSSNIFGMTLTIRNLVNGKYVERPEKLSADDKWTLEYALVDVPEERNRRLYEAIKTRRETALSSAKREATPSSWNDGYLKKLRKISRQGEAWRESQNKTDSANGVKILDLKSQS